MPNKSATYRDLLAKLGELTEEELDKPMVVLTPESEEYYFSVILKGVGDLCGVVEEGTPVLVATSGAR